MVRALVPLSVRSKILVGAAAALAVGAVTLLLVVGGDRPEPRSAAHGSSRAASSAPPSSAAGPWASPTPSTIVAALPRTDDPEAYAREVAQALFDVDPAQTSRTDFLRFWQAQLPTVVYADAAAKGLTLATQNADAIDNLTSSWIPTQQVWDAEAAEQTTSRLRITSVSVPDYWVNAVADGTFRDPGLHMQRVMGVLTQTYGTAPGKHTVTRPVVLDLGLLCGPTQPGGCRLLAPQKAPGTAGATS